MSQLHFYVPDNVEAQIRLQAQQAKMSVSKFIAELVKRETAQHNQWPAEYLSLFDQWQGAPAPSTSELSIEKRLDF
jgi:hypothetical protein